MHVKIPKEIMYYEGAVKFNRNYGDTIFSIERRSPYFIYLYNKEVGSLTTSVENEEYFVYV